MKYPYLLFDADDTLFDFPQADATAFSEMCLRHQVENTPETRNLYASINAELWAAFDRREVSKDFVTLERYVRFFRELGIRRDAAQANEDYLRALGRCCFPVPYAEEVCRTLFQRGHQLCIVTNAVASVQRRRLEGSVLEPFISQAIISEEAGSAKPDKAYFDYALDQLGAASPQDCLVVGDSLSADIQGANNANLPCCWFNPHAAARRDGLRIDYEIRDLRELLEIV